MKRIPLRPRTALALGLCVPLTLALGAGAAAAAARSAPAVHTVASHSQNLIPPHVYAPYFETWTKNNIPAIARKSGAHYLTLAFLQTPKKGSCTVAWDGNPRQTVKPGGRYVHQVRELRAMGGNVVPSFGGYSADEGGTEIADSCTSVPKIAEAYENVVTTYGVTRLDMDVEANSLNNKAGIERRSEAIALLQKWAARTHRTVQIVFTIGVEPWGLPPNCFNVIESAAAHGVRFTVNIMAFDYYIKASETGIEMGKAAIKALKGTHAQLGQLYPQLSQRSLWSIEGITILPGIDDYPKKTEVTYLPDAQALASFARSHGMPEISIWAIQRDNGGCPGAIDSNSCSGIKQPTWAFSHVFDGFTG
jgi:hypothetical protein